MLEGRPARIRAHHDGTFWPYPCRGATEGCTRCALATHVCARTICRRHSGAHVCCGQRNNAQIFICAGTSAATRLVAEGISWTSAPSYCGEGVLLMRVVHKRCGHAAGPPTRPYVARRQGPLGGTRSPSLSTDAILGSQCLSGIPGSFFRRSLLLSFRWLRARNNYRSVRPMLRGVSNC